MVLGSEDPTPLDPVPDPRIRRSEDPDPLDPLACLVRLTHLMVIHVMQGYEKILVQWVPHFIGM